MKSIRAWLALVCLLGFAPVMSGQYALQYSTNGSVITVTGYTGTPANVVIPDFVNSIAYPAFYGCTNLNNITFGKGVTNIGQYAFGYCTNLTNFTILGSGVNIGYESFFNCTGLTNVALDGVAALGTYAFLLCDGLGALTVPASVTNMDYGAFYECINLTNVVIAAPSIGSNCFEYCSELSTVTISNTVTNIENGAFESTGLRQLIIPDSVISIGPSAFQLCTNLSTVIVGSGLATIGSDAFVNCYSLTGIYFSGIPPLANSTTFQSSKNNYDPVTIYYIPGTPYWTNYFATLGPTVPWLAIAPQNLTATLAAPNAMTVQFTGTSNFPYVLQSSASLTAPVQWQPVMTNFAGTNGAGSFTVTNLNAPLGIYQVFGP